MPDPTYTTEQLDENRKFFRDAADGKGQAFVPVKDRAGQVADMLDDLKARRETAAEMPPCRACGERAPLAGGYCAGHQSDDESHVLLVSGLYHKGAAEELTPDEWRRIAEAFKPQLPARPPE